MIYTFSNVSYIQEKKFGKTYWRAYWTEVKYKDISLPGSPEPIYLSLGLFS